MRESSRNLLAEETASRGAESVSNFSISRRRVLASLLTTLATPVLGRAAVANKCDADLDVFISSAMASAGIPGLGVGLARNGRVLLARGYGFADIASGRRVTGETMFHIASITKAVTASAVVNLAAQGRFSLDDDVASFLDFELRNPHHPRSRITFRNLLTHTSGISDARYYEIDFRRRGSDSPVPLGQFLRDYLVVGGRFYSTSDCFSTAQAGSQWDYSNVGYGLLGYLATRIAGEDMRDWTRRKFFAPLGMNHTSWTIAGTPQDFRATPYDVVEGALTPVEPLGSPDWGSSMLRSSIADFTAFVAASANGGVGNDIRILDSGATGSMFHMHRPSGLPEWLEGQGLGWQAAKLDGAIVPNHWGGDPGVFTAAYVEPASRTGVALFTNMTSTSESKTAIKKIAARLLHDHSCR